MNRRQTIPKHLRYTVEDFNRQFPNDEACLEHLKEQRFPGGIAYCEKCRKEQRHHRIHGRPVWSCDECLNQVSPKAGTIFEHTSTSLRLWYYAMYLMASTRCGISAKQIQRETGVTYKTAWRMFKQIRSLLSESDMQLEGEAVEMDESYFGAKRKRGNRRGRPNPSDTSKTAVVGIAERDGKRRVYATVASDTTKKTLHGIAKERIMPESIIFTDEYYSYNGLDQQGYTHKRINHSAGVYVLADGTHTNTIEGFWGLVKNGIRGVYHQVSRKYLQSYLNEYSFRYNRRGKGNLIFNDVLKRACGLVSPRVAEDRGMTPSPEVPF